MRLHRFITPSDLSGSEVEIADLEIVHQIRKVLRLKTGDKFILADGNLNEALVEIKELDKNLLQAKILEKYRNENEPANKTVLYLAILKRENFELAVQKAVEVGIEEIVPVITERTVKTGLNLDRLKKIIKEAAEQSGRGIAPNLHEPIKFEETIENGNKINVIFHATLTSPSASLPPLLNKERGLGGEVVGLFIGPEGGFTEKEIELAKQNNFQVPSLGKLTLRAETAAIVASYLFAK